MTSVGRVICNSDITFCSFSIVQVFIDVISLFYIFFYLMFLPFLLSDVNIFLLQDNQF